MPDVPKSSIYRHLKLLLEGGLIAVMETRPINGIEEKVYALIAAPRVSDPADMAGLSHEEHLHYFTAFVTELLQSYMLYLEQTPQVDMGADRVGYTTVQFYATPEEVDAFSLALNTALLPLLRHGPGDGRALRKLAVVTHPLRRAAPTIHLMARGQPRPDRSAHGAPSVVSRAWRIGRRGRGLPVVPRPDDARPPFRKPRTEEPMKTYARLLGVLLVALLILPPLAAASAQDGGEITLVPFTNETFGIQGLVPEGWREAAPGIYARASSALDGVSLIQQAVPGMSAADLGDAARLPAWPRYPARSVGHDRDRSPHLDDLPDRLPAGRA